MKRHGPSSWGIYQPVVLQLARRRGLQDSDAQDVMQQVFLSISRSIENWNPGALQSPFRAIREINPSVPLPESLGRRATDRRSLLNIFAIGVIAMLATLALGLVAFFSWQAGLSSDVDDSLDGVWELASPAEAKQGPEDQRVRLVIAGDWQGTFQGHQAVSVSRLKIEAEHSPKRLVLADAEGGPLRGIYEVKADRLRLNIAPDTEDLPTEFDSEHPGLNRVTGKLAEEQLNALKQHSKKTSATNANGIDAVAVGPGSGFVGLETEQPFVALETEKSDRQANFDRQKAHRRRQEVESMHLIKRGQRRSVELKAEKPFNALESGSDRDRQQALRGGRMSSR